ncbi:MAG: addiction module protein [Myxococcales bacterium]|nr:addiction module protein [Myxococcales bacterium]
MTDARKLLQDALKLSEEERIAIADALMQSIDLKTRQRLEAARRSKVMERIQKVVDGEADAETFDAVRKVTRDTLVDIEFPRKP